ncbi:tumor necrosis factor receptor superfamily member 1A-like isoform X2 [Eublepharis macularius]|nr:tumor necrosis factor receptor superfamily member 1A-like isoform X2 [Eublepharis macularius]
MKTEASLGTALIPSSKYSHSAEVDKQAFIRSIVRKRRNLQCQQGHYLHPNKTHCCIKCHKGTYVAQHCASEDQTTRCATCPEGAYMSRENFAGKCRGCQHCRSTFKQVELTPCSVTQDTVCGCGSNHYRTTNTPEFLCEPCSTCPNGTIWKECTTSSDTICRCYTGFFLRSDENSCSPCTSCQGGECEKECPGSVETPPREPSGDTDLTPILSSVVVVLAAGVLLLAARWISKQPLPKKLISAFSAGTPQQQQPTGGPPLPQSVDQMTGIPKEPNQEEMLLPPAAIVVSPTTQGLPDCIQSAGETRIPDCPAVLYAVVEHVPFSQWKEFVRRLGLTDNAICRIEAEERHMREAQYEMLRHWRLQLGQRATVERISSVLNEMELSGCSEAIQDMLSRQAGLGGPQGVLERGSPVRMFLS